jgi:hypothetical protein
MSDGTKFYVLVEVPGAVSGRDRYVTEEAFRFNNRLKSDFGRFFQALSQVVGKRLTYRKLAGIGDAGFMGIK